MVCGAGGTNIFFYYDMYCNAWVQKGNKIKYKNIHTTEKKKRVIHLIEYWLLIILVYYDINESVNKNVDL